MREVATTATAVDSSRPGSNGLTHPSSVFERLQQDILSGHLRPGSRLVLKDLAKKYATSTSPLREALNRLSSNGMVVRADNRGFCVSPANSKELLELARTRCWLEEIALRQSIANGDSDWEERIVVAFHWLARASDINGNADIKGSAEWAVRHDDFHIALVSACDASILMDFCAQLQERIDRYRNLAEVVEHSEGHEIEEHRVLLDAALNRDADRATELLAKHHKLTAKIVLMSGRF